MTDEALPRSLRQIAELTSLEVALKLVAQLGGTEVYVPKQPTKSSRLARCVGVDAARRIAELHGGDRLAVPLATAAVRARRDDAIRRLLDDGLSVPEAARRAGVSRRTIHRIKNRKPHRPKPRLVFTAT